MNLPKEVQELIEQYIYSDESTPDMDSDFADGFEDLRARRWLQKGAEIYHAALPSLSREEKQEPEDFVNIGERWRHVWGETNKRGYLDTLFRESKTWPLSTVDAVLESIERIDYPERYAAAHPSPLEGSQDLQKPDRWISVSKKYPNWIGQQVLTRDASGEMKVCYWHDGKWNEPDAGPITHWMPLPRQPRTK